MDEKNTNTTHSPFDYFKEMSPIFCTSEVPFSAIGDHMEKKWDFLKIQKH